MRRSSETIAVAIFFKRPGGTRKNRNAVDIGYRHIDTAQAYGNERGVGSGVRNCGIPREELFVVSKVAAEHKTYDEAMAGINKTLEKMELVEYCHKNTIAVEAYSPIAHGGILNQSEIKAMADKYREEGCFPDNNVTNYSGRFNGICCIGNHRKAPLPQWFLS